MPPQSRRSLLRNSIKRAWADPAFTLYLATVFAAGFAGVGAGRIFLALSLVALVAQRRYARHEVILPATGWWVLAYVAWVSLARLWGGQDQSFAQGLHRHLDWLQIPIAATLICSPARLWKVMSAFAAGIAILSLRVICSAAAIVTQGLRDGLGIDFSVVQHRILLHHGLDGEDIISRLVSAGGMQDGQRLVLGLIAVFFLSRRLNSGKRGLYLVLPLLVMATALFLTFKRGSWIALLLVAIVEATRFAGQKMPALSGRLRSGRVLLPLAVIIGLLAMVSLPGLTKHTISAVDGMVAQGGRACMWFQVSPGIARRHPLGIGFKALTNRKMREIAPQVEPRQTHVHSNILQALIDGGWPGLLLFLAWFARAFRDARGFAVAARGNDLADSARALYLMFAALFLVGLIEYQIGSGQIVFMYGMIMGGAAAGLSLTRKGLL